MTTPMMRILVVEDEYLTACELRSDLERSGVEVVGPVPTVGEALELLDAGHLDGAVLDINLGGEWVFPVADGLRERRVPFVFATGYDGWAIPERYRDAPRLEKPVVPNRLYAALRG